ncbi:MAG TPA: hypothetical protein VF290_19165 [Pyrinomonadaceae bacterium]
MPRPLALAIKWRSSCESVIYGIFSLVLAQLASRKTPVNLLCFKAI